MVSDADNGSSIRNCLRAARENARAVRGTLTTEVWETQNQTWLEFQRLVADGAFDRDPSNGFEWVQVPLAPVARRDRRHDAAGRGLPLPAHRQLPRTGRQHRAASRREVPCGRERIPRRRNGSGKDIEVDFYHWSGILRSVSAFEVYRKVYRNVIRPEKVAELLILRSDMPRSLAACTQEVVSNLERVANEQSGRDVAARRAPAGRPAIRPHRRDSRHRSACLPDAVSRARRHARLRHQPRLPRADGGVSLSPGGDHSTRRRPGRERRRVATRSRADPPRSNLES